MAQVLLLKIGSTGIPQEFDSASDEITLLSGQFGNVLISGNTVESTDTNGDLILTPDGTGNLVLDGVNWPQADGLAGQFLQTDGSGQLSWAYPEDDLEARRVSNEYTAAVNLLANDAVYISAADNVSKAVATNDGAASRMIGFAASAVSATNPVGVVSEGVLSGFSGLTAGSRYYLSSTTAGAIQTSLPTGTGNVIVQVGYAKSSTELHIHIQQLGRRA